VHGSDLG